MRYIVNDEKISNTEKEIKDWAHTFHINTLAKSEAKEIYHEIEWFEDGFYFENPLLKVIRIMLLYGEEASLVALDNTFKEKEIKFTTLISLIDIVNDDRFETYKNRGLLYQVYLKLLEIKERYYPNETISFEL